MTEPKTFASLTPTLLARKGGARPAMRPQLAPFPQLRETTARQAEDLGWNDMGHEPAGIPDAEVVPLNGAVPQPHVPEVVRQRETAAAGLAKRGGTKRAGPRRSALAEGRRAAFTLRLDGERHLKLRLACTIANRSAQQIVTEALDRLLAETPEIDELADRVRKRR